MSNRVEENKKISWEDNLDKLINIRESDPVFWTKLKEIAITINNNEGYYVDDNINYYTDGNDIFIPWTKSKLDSIIIVRKYENDKDGGTAKMSLDGTRYESNQIIGWACPGLYSQTNCQQKNAFYIKSGMVHVSKQCSGCYLLSADMEMLKHGYYIEQYYKENNRYDIERSFSLPADVFLNTMLK